MRGIKESDLFFGGLSGINFCPWCGADKRLVPPTGTAAAAAAAVNCELESGQRQPDPLVAAARRVVEVYRCRQLEWRDKKWVMESSVKESIDELAAALEDRP